MILLLELISKPDSSVGKSKAKGLMHLKFEGCRPPYTLGFTTQLSGKVLMDITAWDEQIPVDIFGKSAFNLWKQSPHKELFTYGCHDSESEINEVLH